MYPTHRKLSQCGPGKVLSLTMAQKESHFKAGFQGKSGRKENLTYLTESPIDERAPFKKPYKLDITHGASSQVFISLRLAIIRNRIDTGLPERGQQDMERGLWQLKLQELAR